MSSSLATFQVVQRGPRHMMDPCMSLLLTTNPPSAYLQRHTLFSPLLAHVEGAR